MVSGADELPLSRFDGFSEPVVIQHIVGIEMTRKHRKSRQLDFYS